MSDYRLRDLLRAINVLDQDTDVTVDGVDSIAVCPPVKLTPTALRKYRKVLNLPVEGTLIKSDNDEDYDEDNENSLLDEAWYFLCALAGYCAIDKFDKWFEGEQAKEL